MTTTFLVLILTVGRSLTKDSDENECLKMAVASQKWSIICEGILSLVVGVFGLFGNVVAIIILSKPSFKGLFNQLSISLACFDSLFIGKKSAPEFRI